MKWQQLWLSPSQADQTFKAHATDGVTFFSHTLRLPQGWMILPYLPQHHSNCSHKSKGLIAYRATKMIHQLLNSMLRR